MEGGTKMSIGIRNAKVRRIQRFILSMIQDPKEEALKLIGDISDAIGKEDMDRARMLMGRLVELHPEFEFREGQSDVEQKNED